jgi:GTP-binding protein
MSPYLLHQTRFLVTASALNQLPTVGLPDHDWREQGLPEIAFVGRSNAGKSTAINLLCNQKRLAFSSKTPGRTQHLNFFEVTDVDRRYGLLVDLPGYGYAAADRATRATWDELLGQYLQNRRALRGVVLMMDARRPLTDLDLQLLDWLEPAAVPVHALLTKADKLNRSQMVQTLRDVEKVFAGSPHSAQLFSALKRMGLEQANEKVLSWLNPNASHNTSSPAAGVS